MRFNLTILVAACGGGESDDPFECGGEDVPDADVARGIGRVAACECGDPDSRARAITESEAECLAAWDVPASAVECSYRRECMAVLRSGDCDGSGATATSGYDAGYSCEDAVTEVIDEGFTSLARAGGNGAESEAEAESEGECVKDGDPCDYCYAPDECDRSYDGDGKGCDCGCEFDDSDC